MEKTRHHMLHAFWARAKTTSARKKKRARTKDLRKQDLQKHCLRAGSIVVSLFLRKIKIRKPVDRLRAQCANSPPDKKAVLKAWAQGARFDHTITHNDPGMYLSSLACSLGDPSQDKSWLWDAMAREGADLAQTDPDGMGFEARAIQEGNAQALWWWKKQGFDLRRKTKDQRSLWLLALINNAWMIPEMAKAWPEEADQQAISDEFYDWMKAWRRIDPDTPSRWRLIETMQRWPEALTALPEVTRPSDELSVFMRFASAGGESVEGAKALEQRALARFERAELSISSKLKIKKSTTPSKSL